MPTIDRRDFLKFVVGGAVGTIVSPMPWVPMDEVAKWTQRWAPIPESGESSYVNSICLLCPGGCGIKVRLIENNRAVKIDGQPNHPVNRGGLCPMGLAGLQVLYHEEIRVKGPMKRFGPRGKGDWLPISWEEAYAELSKHFKTLRQENQTHTAALLDGRGGQGSLSLVMARFMKSFGSPNYIRTPQLGDTEEMVTGALSGSRSRLAYDLPGAKYVLSFGAGLLDGWGTPTWVAQAYREWRKEPKAERTRLVQVESLASTTASLADEWVPVKPGTEGSLAWGMAQIMLSKGLVNREAVQSSGLESLKEVLDKKYTPEKVAKITGLAPAEIEKLAREFASAKQGVALMGRGKGEMATSFSEAAAVHTLNVLSGAMSRTGGVFLKGEGGLSGSWPKASLDGTAERGLTQPRLDSVGISKYPAGQPNYTQFFINAAHKTPYPVNLLMLHEANPAFTLGDAAVKAAVEHIPFIVSFSSFYDETTQLADLILPAPTFLERWDDAYGAPGVPYPVYGLAKPVLPPLHGNRNPGDVLIALAKEIGGSVQEALGFENMESVVKKSAQTVYEMKKGRLADGPVPEGGKYGSASPESFEKFWEGLVREGAWYHLENSGIAGQGKIDLHSAALRLEPEKIDLSFTYYSGGEGLLLMVPLSLMLLQNGYFPNPPFMTKYLGEETLTENEIMAQIHPATAKKFGLNQGDPVQLESAEGTIKARIHLFEGAMPQVVFVPLGMGHQAFDPTLKNRGANPYPMLDKILDPASGLPISWTTRVKIQKI